MCTHTYTMLVANVPCLKLYYDFVNSPSQSLTLGINKSEEKREEEMKPLQNYRQGE